MTAPSFQQYLTEFHPSNPGYTSLGHSGDPKDNMLWYMPTMDKFVHRSSAPNDGEDEYNSYGVVHYRAFGERQMDNAKAWGRVDLKKKIVSLAIPLRYPEGTAQHSRILDRALKHIEKHYRGYKIYQYMWDTGKTPWKLISESKSLQEKFVDFIPAYTGGEKTAIAYYENPNRKELQEIMSTLRYDSIRFAYKNGKIYCWNADSTSHQMFFARTKVNPAGMMTGSLIVEKFSGQILAVSYVSSIMGKVNYPEPGVFADFHKDFEQLTQRLGWKFFGGKIRYHDLPRELKPLAEEYEYGMDAGKSFPYLINPSKKEVLDYIRKDLHKDNREQALRMLVWKGDLYVWDAYHMWHPEFAKKILGHSGGIKLGSWGWIDPKTHSINHQIRIGDLLYKKYKKLIDSLAQSLNLNIRVTNSTDTKFMGEEFFDMDTKFGRERSIYKNPTSKDLREIIKKGNSGRIRFAVDSKKNFYAWNVSDFMHSEFVGFMSANHRKVKLTHYGQMKVNQTGTKLEKVSYFHDKPRYGLWGGGEGASAEFIQDLFYFLVDEVLPKRMPYLQFDIQELIKADNTFTLYDAFKDGQLEESREARIDWLENPSHRQLVRMYKRSEYNELRWLYVVDEKVMYVWDGAYVEHLQFARNILQNTDLIDRRDQSIAGYMYKGFVSRSGQEDAETIQIHFQGADNKEIKTIHDHVKNWKPMVTKVGKKRGHIDIPLPGEDYRNLNESLVDTGKFIYNDSPAHPHKKGRDVSYGDIGHDRASKKEELWYMVPGKSKIIRIPTTTKKDHADLYSDESSDFNRALLAGRIDHADKMISVGGYGKFNDIRILDKGFRAIRKESDLKDYTIYFVNPSGIGMAKLMESLPNFRDRKNPTSWYNVGHDAGSTIYYFKKGGKIESFTDDGGMAHEESEKRQSWAWGRLDHKNKNVSMETSPDIPEGMEDSKVRHMIKKLRSHFKLGSQWTFYGYTSLQPFGKLQENCRQKLIENYGIDPEQIDEATVNIDIFRHNKNLRKGQRRVASKALKAGQIAVEIELDPKNFGKTPSEPEIDISAAEYDFVNYYKDDYAPQSPTDYLEERKSKYWQLYLEYKSRASGSEQNTENMNRFLTYYEAWKDFMDMYEEDWWDTQPWDDEKYENEIRQFFFEKIKRKWAKDALYEKDVIGKQEFRKKQELTNFLKGPQKTFKFMRPRVRKALVEVKKWADKQRTEIKSRRDKDTKTIDDMYYDDVSKFLEVMEQYGDYHEGGWQNQFDEWLDSIDISEYVTDSVSEDELVENAQYEIEPRLNLSWDFSWDSSGFVELASEPVAPEDFSDLVADLFTISEYKGSANASCHVHIDRPKGFKTNGFDIMAVAMMLDSDNITRDDVIGAGRSEYLNRWARDNKEYIINVFNIHKYQSPLSGKLAHDIHGEPYKTQYYGMFDIGRQFNKNSFFNRSFGINALTTTTNNRTIEFRFPSSTLVTQGIATDIMNTIQYFSFLIHAAMRKTVIREPVMKDHRGTEYMVIVRDPSSQGGGQLSGIFVPKRNMKNVPIPRPDPEFKKLLKKWGGASANAVREIEEYHRQFETDREHNRTRHTDFETYLSNQTRRKSSSRR